MLAPLGFAGWLWLAAHHVARFGAGWTATGLILLVGPATVVPLSLFAYAARR